VRASDYGTPVLQLWAAMHEKETIPRDPVDDQLLRLDLGTLLGAWAGCLVYAAAMHGDRQGTWVVELEYVPIGGGHVDALFTFNATGARYPLEIKSGYDDKPPKVSTAHRLQVGRYALAPDVQAERCGLLYVKPSAPAGKRVAQVEFAVDDALRDLVAEEEARLAPALLDEQPACDPFEFWHCKTCRVGWCDRNKNKNADSVEALFS
jgi:hypothetical protein